MIKLPFRSERNPLWGGDNGYGIKPGHEWALCIQTRISTDLDRKCWSLIHRSGADVWAAIARTTRARK